MHKSLKQAVEDLVEKSNTDLLQRYTVLVQDFNDLRERVEELENSFSQLISDTPLDNLLEEDNVCKRCKQVEGPFESEGLCVNCYINMHSIGG